MTKKDIIERLKTAGVEFDETLTAKALISQFPEILKDESEEESESEEVSEHEAQNAVHFKIRDVNNMKNHYRVRTFSREEHGDDFLALANSFEKANTHKRVQNSDSKTNGDEVKEVMDWNRNIRHQIIERKDE